MSLKMPHLSRGALARQSGVNSETIRYYENIKLMPEPNRSDGGHRIYNNSDLERLSFIRRCRELGFTLVEIRQLLNLVGGGDYRCEDIQERLVRHVSDVREKINDLRKMERSLKKMINECETANTPECPAIGRLYSSAS